MCKVSVLMPIFKTKEKYLRESIDSILNQTYTNFEFIILDDCPEDSREKIIKEYKDNRIIYKKNDKNLGISASRNKLLNLAQGEYIAIFDHDDISVPERLEKQVGYLDTHPFVGVVSGQLEYIVGEHYITKHPEFNLDIKKELMHRDIVAHTAMMIRKSLINQTGIHYESLYSPCEDYMLVLRLVEYTMFYNLQEVLVKYRNSEENTTHLQSQKMMDADALCRCFAYRKYPYLYKQKENISNYDSNNTIYWIKIFDIIPLIKIKNKNNKTNVFLFGIIKIFSIKNKS